MIRDIVVRMETDGNVTFFRDGRLAPPSTTSPLKAIVCGGRTFKDYRLVLGVLGSLNLGMVVHGAARGADTLASRAARELGVAQIACPADWDTHPKRAGLIRNQEMLAHKPDMVIAFPGKSGTGHMVSIADRAGVPVFRITAARQNIGQPTLIICEK